MPKGVKGSKTVTLTDTLAVKLTPEQKTEATLCALTMGAKVREQIGNQGYGLAAIALANKLVQSGDYQELIDAYREADLAQTKFIAEATKLAD